MTHATPPVNAPQAQAQSADRCNTWKRAFANLPEDDQKIISEHQIKEEAEALAQTLDTLLEDKENRRIRLVIGGRTVALYDVYDNVAGWLKQFKEVGDIAVQFDPIHAAIPWAAVRFILQSATNHAEKNRAIIEGSEHVSQFVLRARLLEKEKVVIRDSLEASSYEEHLNRFSDALQLFCESILQCSIAIIRHLDRSRVQRAVGNVFVDKTKYQEFIDNMRENYRLAEEAIAPVFRTSQIRSNDMLHELREKLDDLQAVRSNVSLIHDDMKVAAHVSESQRMINVLEWLSPRLHLGAAPKRGPLKGTGKWIHDTIQFSDWVNMTDGSGSSLLWLYGAMGTGKTTLFKSIVQELVRGYNDNFTNACPVFFYCVRTAQPQKLLPLLCCLLRQLATTSCGDVVHDSLLNWYTGRREREDLNCEDVEEMIVKVLKARQESYILIDAFDECDSEAQVELMNFIHRAISEVESTVRVLVTSRTDLSEKRHRELSMNIGRGPNQADIETYIEHRMHDLPEIPNDLQKQLKYHLMDGVQGMFQWVNAQFELLPTSRRNARNQIKRYLQRPVKGGNSLNETYQTIYQERMACLGNEVERQITRSIFRLLLCCQQQVNSKDFIDLISCQAAKLEDLEYDPDYPMELSDVLNSTFSLVVHDEETDNFCFAHQSVREFFDQISKVGGLGENDNFSDWRNNSEAAVTCIQVILDFHELSISGFGALRYAKLLWAEHLKLYYNLRGDARDSAADVLAKSFLREENAAFSSWCAEMEDFYEVGGGFQFPSWWETRLCNARNAFLNVSNSLLLACEWGFLDIVESYVSELQDAATLEGLKTIKGSNALHVSIAREKSEGMNAHAWIETQCKILCLLLRTGMRADAEDKYGVTPLHVAVNRKNLEAVKVLLTYGANPSWLETDGSINRLDDPFNDTSAIPVPTSLQDAAGPQESEIV